MIEQHGGKNVGSVSAKTSFILAGANMGPEKLKKAESLGVRLLNEEEFLAMIKPEEIKESEVEHQTDEHSIQDYHDGLNSKLMGQVNLVAIGRKYANDTRRIVTGKQIGRAHV